VAVIVIDTISLTRPSMLMARALIVFVCPAITPDAVPLGDAKTPAVSAVGFLSLMNEVGVMLSSDAVSSIVQISE
jgi:hypothetical protein